MKTKAFDLVFEDPYLLVINKKARIVVQPTPRKEKITLTSLAEKEISQKLYLCHRLDKETRGLIIYAKSQKIKEKIASQFKLRRVTKKYFALSQGNFKKRSGVFKSKILDKNGRKFREKPKEAETVYQVIENFAGFDFLRIMPKTGRTNQIRIHLAEAGHPILGEKRYAFRRDFVIKSNKLALCAYFLSFWHPVSNEKIELEIGIPDYIKILLKRGG